MMYVCMYVASQYALVLHMYATPHSMQHEPIPREQTSHSLHQAGTTHKIPRARSAQQKGPNIPLPTLKCYDWSISTQRLRVGR